MIEPKQVKKVKIIIISIYFSIQNSSVWLTAQSPLFFLFYIFHINIWYIINNYLFLNTFVTTLIQSLLHTKRNIEAFSGYQGNLNLDSRIAPKLKPKHSQFCKRYRRFHRFVHYFPQYNQKGDFILKPKKIDVSLRDPSGAI